MATAITETAFHPGQAASGAVPPEDHAQLYRRFLERNPEFDGQFLTGVVSTGIYCLPSCPARRPKPENVRFFETPDEARRQGFRPCRRCHPDALYRGEAWQESVFEQTAERLRREPAAFADLNAAATAAGVGRSALNQLFQEHAQESAGAFLRQARVEKACEVLRHGATPLEALAESGFESASAFHQQFAARTGLTPAPYARLAGATEFSLRLPPRYRTREVLDFQGRDRDNISESITSNGFRKCIQVGSQAAVIHVSFENGSAICRTDSCDVYAAHKIVLRMLGFGSDPSGFERHHAGDEVLGEVIRRQAGLRIPLTVDAWEALAWAVIGQQISVAAAVRLRRELIAGFGMRHSSGMIAHPSAETVADLEPSALGPLRFPAFKAEYLIAAARAVASGALRLSRDWSALHLAREMRHVRGIGPWTIQYSLMRGAGFADCLPAADAGLARGLEQLTGERLNEAAIRKLMERFAPFRSLATYHVWQSLPLNRAQRGSE